jgi:glycosyltransferase involved in cell wall biosynthesis
MGHEIETTALSRHIVGLFATDFGRRGPTGLGRYSLNLSCRLMRGIGPASQLSYRLGGSPLPAKLSDDGFELPVARSRLPRKLLHASWLSLGRPRIDRGLDYPDLVHVLYPSTPVPTRAPTVYTVHDLFPLSHPEWFTPKARWMFERSLAHAIAEAVQLIANSQATASDLSSRLGVRPGRIEVVPMAVDDAFFEAPPQEEVQRVCHAYDVIPGGYLLVLGAVSARKNLPPVLMAMARLRKTGHSPVLLAVGPADHGHEQVAQMVQRLELGSTVRFTGWLSGPELRALLSGALALVHPARDEGFGMTPLEAMASGVPAVVSNRGALPEVTGGAALLADPDDPDTWFDAILRLRDDVTLRHDLIQRGHRRANLFRWDQVTSKTAEIHRSLVDGFTT